jgi:predicted HicB family RNase H-like nuclease
MPKPSGDAEEVKTTIRIPRALLRAAKVWAAQHDRSFNDAVIEGLRRLTKEAR